MKQYIVLEKQSKATWEGTIVEVDLPTGTYRTIGMYPSMAQAAKARDAREFQCCGDNNGTLKG